MWPITPDASCVRELGSRRNDAASLMENADVIARDAASALTLTFKLTLVTTLETSVHTGAAPALVKRLLLT